MGRFRKVEHQREQLQELRGIIASMKTLSQLELHKLGGLAGEHHEMVRTLEHVASDFLSFYPRPDVSEGDTLWLVIGAERGFCGDFNESLLKHLRQACPDCVKSPQRVLAVGRRLWGRMEEGWPGFVPLPGASVSEELPQALSRVVAETQAQLSGQQASALRLLYHGDEPEGVFSRRLLPPEIGAGTVTHRTPPLLQLPPERFFTDFLQHYLFLALTEIFTVSLLAENRYRVQHLEGAVQRLDERLEVLAGRARALRQEEITEEIETILLGTEGA